MQSSRCAIRLSSDRLCRWFWITAEFQAMSSSSFSETAFGNWSGSKQRSSSRLMLSFTGSLLQTSYHLRQTRRHSCSPLSTKWTRTFDRMSSNNRSSPRFSFAVIFTVDAVTETEQTNAARELKVVSGERASGRCFKTASQYELFCKLYVRYQSAC